MPLLTALSLCASLLLLGGCKGNDNSVSNANGKEFGAPSASTPQATLQKIDTPKEETR